MPTKLYFLIHFVAFTILLFLHPIVTNECRHRKYLKNESTVCVCTEHYCDTFEPLKRTKPGIVQKFRTAFSNDRFKYSEINFNDKNPNQEKYITIQIDRNRTYQKIIGFGGAFTDSVGYNLMKLSESLRKRLIEDYFSSDGIEYTIGRVPIGGCDFSTRPYTYDDEIDDYSLQKFSLQMEDYKYKIPFMKYALKVSPHKVKYFASPWSPPAWMKTNNNLIHGGFLKGHPGGKYYKMFAKYFVKFLQAYEKENITFWAITILNEPGSGFDPFYRWNCLGLDAEMERDFLKMDLGPELYKNGYTKDKLSIIIYDDQLTNITKFTETIMSDKQASKFVSGIGFHWYHNDNANRNDLDSLMKKYSNTFLLATEACAEWKKAKVHVHLGSWYWFNRYVEDIIEDLNHFTTGWVDWNLALDIRGGPNWVENFVSSPVIVNVTGQEYYKQPIFYAMGHFSKFLVPGSIRIHFSIQTTLLDQQTDLIRATVFLRPDNAIVMILLNTNQKSIPVTVKDEKRGVFHTILEPQSLINFMWY